jgi:translation initiation factor IF-2
VPEGTVVIERGGTAQDVGPKLMRTASDIVRWLLINGEMVMATQVLTDQQVQDYADSLDVEIRIVEPGEEREEEMRDMLDVEDLDERDGEPRPPVITVMGHVDHGKTKLLDVIRSANVVDREAGGITQHIGAYQVLHDGNPLTFIDTPGHAAFTAIRARGAEATDIVVLVVAADDGVMPQTVEAIDHAKAAEVPIIVAINKMDREGADPDKVMSQLSERGLVPEEWGGDTQMVRISALQNDNIDGLLDVITLTAEVEELEAPATGRAAGVVLEANVQTGKGPVATILVQQGIVEVGQPLVAGGTWGRVRALINDKGERVKTAGPSTPVEVLGLSDVPRAGDEFVIAQDEKTAGKVAETRAHYRRVAGLGRDASSAASGARLEDLFADIQSANAAKLELIVRADMHGSLEALTQSLMGLERPEVKIRILSSNVGAPTENDVQLAQAAGATIIAFNVRPDRGVRTTAAQENVEIRTYEIIYDVIEDIEQAVIGMLEPEFKEVVTGEAEVREVFRIKGVGLVAGCLVQSGVITRNDKVRFLREGTVIWHGTLTSLKRFQDDATEVRAGFECGVGLSDMQDLIPGDIIETYEEQEIPRT